MAGRQVPGLAGLIGRVARTDGMHATEVSSLTLFRFSAPSEPISVLYEPSLCVVAQGSKQVLLADEVYRYDPGQFLLVSVDLPVAGQVVEASPAVPYLALSPSTRPWSGSSSPTTAASGRGTCRPVGPSR